MIKKRENILLFFLFLFSVYCALNIGQSWDQEAELLKGKVTIDYLFSFGEIDKYITYRENYSSIYLSLQYLITKILPTKYEVQISHLVNLFFSLATIFGISKICKIVFNKKISKIVFLILFFYPVYFGHMGFNSKDTILSFSHVWITYLAIKYLTVQDVKEKSLKSIIYIGILLAVATGIQLVFLGSLLPIILFIFLEIFFFKKIICKKFSQKKFFIDLLKCFLVFYLLLIFFWIDAHPNIFTLPFEFLMGTFESDYKTGWCCNLINKNYYLSNEVPNFYFLTNFIYKSPEYILISYFLFVIIFIRSKSFFQKKIKYFNAKISFLVFILIYPDMIALIIPYPIYDGLRLFLWAVPYFCIIPAVTIYYLIENFKNIKSKITLFILSFFIILFVYNFLAITPYHYTYLNNLNGNSKQRYKSFENDYWSSSLNELIKISSFNKNKNLKFSTCGVSDKIVEKYLYQKGYFNIEFVSPKDSEFIIMTNRAILDYDINNNINITNCFVKFVGDDIFKVERNGLTLSIIRKIN
mgnify:CR=1 FL=1